ncbi:conserved hypothetical protein [Vibrio phage 275E43-1]|nr:conserved hypothetical protein [Vibrio phage 275E43-1]
MTVIVRHPDLNDRRWTKVVQGQGGALIRPETYEIVPNLLLEDCEQVGAGLQVSGNEWLSSPDGTIYRSAGMIIEGNGTTVVLLVVDILTGQRRRLGPATMRSMTPVVEGLVRSRLGTSSSSFTDALHHRAESARINLERAESTVAVYRALASVQHARDILAANNEVQQSVPVPDEQVWTVSSEPTTFQQELEAASPARGTPQEVVEGASRATDFASMCGASSEVTTTSLNEILRHSSRAPSQPFRGTVRRRRG